VTPTLAVILTLSEHSEPKGKDPCISLGVEGRSPDTKDAVIPSVAAKRRSRGTPAFAFGFLYLITGVSSTSATAQSSAAISANAEPAKPFIFEIVSIRPHQPGAERMGTEYLPNGYNVSGVSIAYLIQLAYMPKDGYIFSSSRIENAPLWLSSDLYDVEARVALEDQPAWQKAQTGISSELLQSSLREALKDRSKLAVYITTDQAPGLNLVVGKHGPRIRPTVPGTVRPVIGKTSKAGDGFFIQDNGTRQFVGVSMADLARVVTRLTGNQIVSDKTGLAGHYDFTLPWYEQSPEVRGVDQMPLSSIGLALKPGMMPIIVINIDHIEKPDAN
jgi:uncharacterized protein (TIGR03435 family)